ncbi:MAG: chorismate-binding protein, partial [Nocardioidaceae bacterium]
MSWSDPVAAFTDLARRHERMFWLDGGGSRAWSGRRSILGWLEDDDVSLSYDANLREVLRHRGGGSEVVGDDIFTVLDEEIARDGGDPTVSWVGWFGYASRADLPALTEPVSGVPDAVWMRAPRRLVFDHEPTAGRPGGAGSSGGAGLSKAVAREKYDAWFALVQEQLRLGNTYEVNLTYRESLTRGTDPVEAYLRLRALNPAPYAAYLRHHDVSVLSSSPERFATIDRNRWVETKPIKGTTPRGATPAEDEAHRRSLATDPRYRAENLMIVDLLRNDLSMVCEPGTVTVPVLM